MNREVKGSIFDCIWNILSIFRIWTLFFIFALRISCWDVSFAFKPFLCKRCSNTERECVFFVWWLFLLFESQKWLLTWKSSLFWDVTQRRLVVSYRSIVTSYRSHLQGPSSTARICSYLPTFRGNLSVSSSRVYQSMNCWTLEVEADRLSRNVDNSLPIYAA
jgi:hypothetical protein